MAETVSAEDRNNAKLAHIINGFFPLIGGLIFWMQGKDKSKFIDEHGKEAVNFGIFIWAAEVVFWILLAIIGIVTAGIGFLLGFLGWGIWIYSVVMGFQAGGVAEKGESYKYPISPLRLVK